SNFLLWQLAYTELYMTPVLWPDVTRRDLFQAILDYQRRERRFGKVTAPTAPTAPRLPPDVPQPAGPHRRRGSRHCRLGGGGVAGGLGPRHRARHPRRAGHPRGVRPGAP